MNNLIGITLIIIGLAFIIFIIKIDFKSNIGLSYKIKGIGVGLMAIISGIAFILGCF